MIMIKPNAGKIISMSMDIDGFWEIDIEKKTFYSLFTYFEVPNAIDGGYEIAAKTNAKGIRFVHKSI